MGDGLRETLDQWRDKLDEDTVGRIEQEIEEREERREAEEKAKQAAGVRVLDEDRLR